MTNRVDLLNAAIAHTSGERDVEYGSPQINMSDCAALWSAYLTGRIGYRIALGGEDVAILNVLQKISRTYHGKPKADTYEDMAAYSAIAGELAFHLTGVK